jgi:RNA polymerase sigma factor (sigma-70 family)
MSDTGRVSPDPMDPDELASLVERAQGGDPEALLRLMAEVRDPVYRLAIRMVTRRADAEDATQEILIRVMTRLSTFRGEAAFTTWVHRIAVNHLLDRRKSCAERAELDFELFGQDLAEGLSSGPSSAPDAALLADEVRLACTQALLTCLDRDHRVAYVLGEILGVTSQEGAWICDVTGATYRKRLSRARARLREFLTDHCGWIDPTNACRCDRRVDVAVRLGRVDPDDPEYSHHPATTVVAELEELSDVGALMRSHPRYVAPESVAQHVAELVGSGRYSVFVTNEPSADRTRSSVRPSSISTSAASATMATNRRAATSGSATPSTAKSSVES